MSVEELKPALIEAGRGQVLECGLRVNSISGGADADSPLGDPVIVHKFYLDGREELVRGC